MKTTESSPWPGLSKYIFLLLVWFAAPALCQESETGHLTIDVDPHSEIYIDSFLVSDQSFSRLALQPGTYRIQVQDSHDFSWDSRPVEETVRIMPSAEIKLDYRQSRFAKIKSQPSGSDVYLGSIWLGRTPLNIRQETLEGQSVILRKNGYNERTFTLQQITESDYLKLNRDEKSKNSGVFEASLGGTRVNWFRESFILTSFVSSWAGFLFKRKADQSYNAYLNSSLPPVMERHYNNSQTYDRYSEVAIAVSVTSLTVYLLMVILE